jgi:hypothetical protein
MATLKQTKAKISGFWSPETGETARPSAGGEIFDATPTAPQRITQQPYTPSYGYTLPSQYQPAVGGTPSGTATLMPNQESAVSIGQRYGAAETGGGIRTVSSERIQPIPTGSTTRQTTTWQPGGPAPEMGELPKYEALPYDQRRIAALTQKKAGPARRAAMRTLQRAFAQSYQSKPMRDIAIRSALREYGQAYGQILTSAETAAESQYAQERAEQVRQNIVNYEAELKKQELNFRATWDAWLKGGTQVTTGTTTQQYTTPAAAVGLGGVGGATRTDVWGRPIYSLPSAIPGKPGSEYQ